MKGYYQADDSVAQLMRPSQTFNGIVDIDKLIEICSSFYSKGDFMKYIFYVHFSRFKLH